MDKGLRVSVLDGKPTTPPVNSNLRFPRNRPMSHLSEAVTMVLGQVLGGRGLVVADPHQVLSGALDLDGDH